MKKRSLIIFTALVLVPLILFAQISGSSPYASFIRSFLAATTTAAARTAIGAVNSGSGGALTNAVVYGSTSGSWTFGSTAGITSSSAATLGVGTSAPGKAVEINSATGACLQLTYNDSDGSAANKATFDVSSGGNLTVVPSGGTATVTGGLTVSGTTAFQSASATANAFSGGSAFSYTFGPSVRSTPSSNASGPTGYGYAVNSASPFWLFGFPTSSTKFVIGSNTTGFNTTPTSLYISVDPATSVVGFGGSTSSSPGVKPSSTTLAVRLADDSADAPISASNGTFSGKISSTATSTTLAAAATTLAITSNVVTVTGDAGANTLATITGGLSGQILTLIFVDSLVTVTDSAAGTANTVNLSAAFTSTSNDTLTLVFNGTSWREVARSVN